MNISSLCLIKYLPKDEEQQSRDARLGANLKPGLLSALLFKGIIIKAVALGRDGHLG